MRSLMLLAIASFAFFGCKKKTETEYIVKNTTDTVLVKEACPPDSPLLEYMNFNNGSYWVYQGYKNDSSGKTRLAKRDSIYIDGDTLINGFTYKKVGGSMSPFEGRYQPIDCIRDSAGVLVSINKRFALNLNQFNDTIQHITYPNFSQLNGYLVFRNNRTRLVSSVRYPTLESTVQHHLQVNANQVATYEQINGAYTKGIGLVYYDYAYASQIPSGGYLSYELVKYELK